MIGTPIATVLSSNWLMWLTYSCIEVVSLSFRSFALTNICTQCSCHKICLTSLHGKSSMPSYIPTSSTIIFMTLSHQALPPWRLSLISPEYILHLYTCPHTENHSSTHVIDTNIFPRADPILGFPTFDTPTGTQRSPSTTHWPSILAYHPQCGPWSESGRGTSMFNKQYTVHGLPLCCLPSKGAHRQWSTCEGLKSRRGMGHVLIFDFNRGGIIGLPQIWLIHPTLFAMAILFINRSSLSEPINPPWIHWE